VAYSEISRINHHPASCYSIKKDTIPGWFQHSIELNKENKLKAGISM